MDGNNWISLKKQLLDVSSANNIPIVGTFELTPRCNLKCKMCYVRLDNNKIADIGRELSASEWINMGRQALKAGTLMLLLTGGEVFVRPDFKEIYEALNQMGFVISIFTNGTLLTREIVDWLTKIPPARIRFTLYGASNDTYYKVTGDPFGFDKVSKAIDLALESNLPLSLSSTLIDDNFNDLAAMHHYAKERNLPFSSSVNVLGSSRVTDTQAKSCRIDDDHIRNMIQSARIESPAYSSSADPMSRCKNINNSYFLTWNGKMTLCSMMNEPNSYPLKSGFIEAWRELGRLMRQVTPPAECVDCMYKPYCQSCPGILAAETGSCGKTSPHICNMAKSVYQKIQAQHCQGSLIG